MKGNKTYGATYKVNIMEVKEPQKQTLEFLDQGLKKQHYRYSSIILIKILYEYTLLSIPCGNEADEIMRGGGSYAHKFQGKSQNMT